MKIRTFHDLGKAIQAVAPNYRVEVRKSWSSTDREPRGVRWRISGKGRTGLRIEVFAPDGKLVLDHDTVRNLPHGLRGRGEGQQDSRHQV